VKLQVSVGRPTETASSPAHRALLMIPLVVILSAWVLWRDVGVYRAGPGTRLGGPTYRVSSYDTKAECEVEQRAKMVIEEQARGGRPTERLPDGIMSWDPDRQHYTTFRYLCSPGDAVSAPF